MEAKESISRHGRGSLYLAIITAILIGLFFFTGMEKVWYHQSFVIKLWRQPLPEWMKGLLEWGLPISEMAVVALLAIKRTRLLGLWASAIMMLAFAGYTAYAATEPRGYVPCACGKVFNALSWGQHFWVNMGFFALAVAGIRLYYLQKKYKKGAKGDAPDARKNIAQSPG